VAIQTPMFVACLYSTFIAFMLYLRELHLPITPQLPINFHNKTVTGLIATNRATDKLLHENTERSFQTADKYYNRKTVDAIHNAGHTMLLYDKQIAAGEMQKFHCFFTNQLKLWNAYHIIRIA